MSQRRTSREGRIRQGSATCTSTTYIIFHPVDGTDSIKKNGVLIRISTKLYNICAMIEYQNKSMEELRLEYYYHNRNIGRSSTNFENKSTTSLSLFSTSAPVTTMSAIATPFNFDFPSAAYLNNALNTGFHIRTSAAIPEPFTFRSGETTTTFDFVSAFKKLDIFTSNNDKKEVSTTQRQSRKESSSSRTFEIEIVPICVDCEGMPHMLCLHCSKQVCLTCAQKHVTLVDDEVNIAQDNLQEKMNVLDRLSAAAKERVNAERDKIIQQADIERDQAYVQIDQLLEQHKKQLQDKGTQLKQLTLEKIPSYIQSMTTEIEKVNEENDQLFCITCTPAKIDVQHKH